MVNEIVSLDMITVDVTLLDGTKRQLKFTDIQEPLFQRNVSIDENPDNPLMIGRMLIENYNAIVFGSSKLTTDDRDAGR